MKVEVKRKDELSHNRWSGGVTTQLAIWPEGADYGARLFDWRISTAIVEDEKSVFTALPGIHRLLMILDGEIEVTHNGERALAMKPLADVDEFEGGWETVSVGRCVDFNLMTVDGYPGAMAACAAGGSSSWNTPRAWAMPQRRRTMRRISPPSTPPAAASPARSGCSTGSPFWRASPTGTSTPFRATTPTATSAAWTGTPPFCAKSCP